MRCEKQWKEEHLKVDLQHSIPLVIEHLRRYSFVEEIIFFKQFVALVENATKLENKLQKIAIELGKRRRIYTNILKGVSDSVCMPRGTSTQLAI